MSSSTTVPDNTPESGAPAPSPPALDATDLQHSDVLPVNGKEDSLSLSSVDSASAPLPAVADSAQSSPPSNPPTDPTATADSDSDSTPAPPPEDQAPGKPQLTYPELPHVGIQLFNRVYTHKSLHGPQYTLGHDYLRAPDDYERLAFVGAAALQLCVAQLACELHPKKVVGFLTVWRDGLICTDMLALWARAYDMPRHLKTAPGLGELPGKPKTAAALFEAYVGALVQHAGLPAAAAFVRELVGAQLALQPELRASVLVHTPPSTPPPASPGKEQKDVKTNPLELLNIHAAQTGRRIEWRDEPHGPEHSKSWKMTLIIDGVVRGEGHAERKHKGKLIAAEQAWEVIRAELVKPPAPA